jgi:Spy/CpxP family protein refolding chaperone
MTGFKRMAFLVSLSLALLFPGVVLAQRPPLRHGDPQERPGERERIRENIETLRMWKLLEALDLSSEQSTQFLAVLKDLQDAKKAFEERRREHLSELEAALESEKTDERKLKEALNGLESARKQFQADMENFMERSKAMLTLEQRARMHLFEERFERRLKETIHRMREKGSRW